jgi:hypothetical protein
VIQIMAQFGSPAEYARSYANCSPPAPSRSTSPKFNIADFEQRIQLPTSALTTDTRETSYASQAAIDDLDFARSQSKSPATNRYSRSIKSSFLGRSASKFLPKAIATTNLPVTPPASQAASGSSSPTKSLSSFITGNSVSTISSSASKASVRAKTTSKVLFDSYFNGNSNDLQLGVLQPHSRTGSIASTSPEEDGYEPDYENMAAPQSYTRSPVRTRPRRSPTAESTSSTYTSKLGSWFKQTASPKTASPTTTSAREDDPLVNLDMQSALFPYGPVDPLNPSSFNDLLAAAEAVITTYQNAYKQRVAELDAIKSDSGVKQDELEECETRAMHLKMQLQDLGEQCTAQTQRADTLEGMLRDQISAPVSRCDCEHQSRSLDERRRRRNVDAERPASDSGFESDGDSVFSQVERHDTIRIKSLNAPSSAPQSQSFGTLNFPSSMFSNDLRRENEMLRMRVVELEGAVEGCLDLISNPYSMA